MTALEDISQVEIERMLMDRAAQANKARLALRKKARDVGMAKAAYKGLCATVALRFRAKEVETGEKLTESLREAQVNADDNVKDAALRFYLAEAEFDAEQEAARLLRTEMAAFQSVLADLRPMVSER